MLMKKLVTYLCIVGCWMAWLSTASCTQNDDNADITDTSNLYVTFSTRVSEPDPLLRPREGIRSLRLILIQEGKVLRNYQEDFGADGQPVVQKTITFLGIPNKDISIYAIANEESVGLDLTNIAVGTPFGETEKGKLMNTVINNTGRYYFPRTEEALELAGRYLPMTGTAEYRATGEKTQHVAVELTRMTAKMEITFVNQTGADLAVDKIQFGKGASPTLSYLFDQNGRIPEGTTYNNHYIETGGKVLPKGEESQPLVVYFCESAAGAGSYQLGLNELTDFPLTDIIDNATMQPVDCLPRNTCLQVRATAHPQGWELHCTVAPWDYTETEIDYKNQLSYNQGTWEKDTYLSKQGSTIQLIPDVNSPAVLHFTIQTPNTAKWTASLTDETYLEIVEGFDAGKAVDENGKPITQTIKVRVKNPDAQGSYSAQLVVIAVIGDTGSGKSYEMNLVGGSSASTTEERFTILQSN